MTEFQYIDRRKRLLVRFLDIFSFALIIFFIACFYPKYDHQSTVIEDLLGFGEHWRVIGMIGLPLSIIILPIMKIRIRFKKGRMILFEDKIELVIKEIKTSYYISQIEKIKLVLDLPYEGDERLYSQKASRLKFTSLNKKYDIEFSTQTRDTLDKLRPYSKIWKEKIKNYSEEYR